MPIGLVLMAGIGLAMVVSAVIGRVRWIPRVGCIEAMIGSLAARIVVALLGFIWLGFVGYLFVGQ